MGFQEWYDNIESIKISGRVPAHVVYVDYYKYDLKASYARESKDPLKFLKPVEDGDNGKPKRNEKYKNFYSLMENAVLEMNFLLDKFHSDNEEAEKLSNPVYPGEFHPDAAKWEADYHRVLPPLLIRYRAQQEGKPSNKTPASIRSLYDYRRKRLKRIADRRSQQSRVAFVEDSGEDV